MFLSHIFYNDDLSLLTFRNVLNCKFVFGTISASAGSILDISKYRDTCERSISILDGIEILIEYRMIRRYLGDISYDPEYRPI